MFSVKAQKYRAHGPNVRRRGEMGVELAGGPVRHQTSGPVTTSMKTKLAH